MEEQRSPKRNWAHPDDVLVENWGTTGVSPGTYYPGLSGLRTCDRYGGNCVPYGDESSYTVVAGGVTYLNLYPVYLPDAKSSSGFTSYTNLRNNSTSDTNMGVTTWFDYYAAGRGQGDSTVPPKGIATFVPTDMWQGAGVVVSSERSGVVTLPQSGDQVYGYTGVSIRSAQGLAAARTLYMPNFLSDYYTWRSMLYVMNTGTNRTNITLTFYGMNGGVACQ